MSRVAIVTDSTANIPLEAGQGYPIFTVPMQVIWNEKIYRDGIDLHPREFYQLLRNTVELPTTSQPSPEAFKDIFSRLTEEGHDILSIHISAGLSGTLNSAVQAKDMLPEARIEIIDSRTTSMAMGFQVLKAARAARRGASLEECKQIVENLRPYTEVYFVLNTLEFLHRGGRIGAAANTLGTMLDIKPILKVADGRIESVERVRLKGKAINRMLELVRHQVGDRKIDMLSVLYFQDEADAGRLLRHARTYLSINHNADVFQACVGPVIGTHTGPEGVGLAFLTCD